jgi:hexosaminidase
MAASRRPRHDRRAVLSVLSVCGALALPAAAPAQAPTPPTARPAPRHAVIPLPRALTPREGAFRFTGATRLVADSALLPVARRFARALAAPTGFEWAVLPARAAGASVPAGTVRLVRDPALAPTLGEEGYRLRVAPDGIEVRAAAPAGAFYALQTVRQLLPAAAWREAPVPGTVWEVPAVEIEDAPRFAWRGAHLDVSRHFMPREFVRKYIDLLAMHKLNRFHWHLTEDQGWRIEIRKHPRLTAVGGCREQTLVGPYVSDPAKQVFDGTRHCGFYTQEDVREIVAYAAERFVTVVPEIEMPGHAQAAIAAYPALGVFPDSAPGVRQVWGVSEFILNPEPATVAFMQDVLAEVLELFPGPFIHVGGDEAVKTQWKASARVQARIRELGLSDEHELQSWFIRQMDTFLAQRGRRLVGWDEILEGGLAPGATVMSWRGMDGGIAAAKAGHDVIMAPGSHTYFDHYQSQDRAREPLAIGGFTPLGKVYAFEPVPPQLSADEARRVLGAQAQLWTEYMPTPKHVEYMAFPRLAALAEVVWTPTPRRDFADFLARLGGAHLARLDARDVNYRRLQP